MPDDFEASESAATLAGQIRRKEISPVEVVESAIARIEAHNPKINALIIFGYDDARKAAKAAEAAIMRGDAVGPLHGVPVAMKDCFDFKPGWVTTFGGIRALKNYVVDNYCMFVERMEKAGAIFVGKTNSPVFGFRGTCDNYLYGPSKNPFDLTKNTGGSSGGSAGAVAAGLLPLCEGTDGGGSIRIPSSWCGVYRLQALLRARAAGDPARGLRRQHSLHLRRPDHPHGRGRRLGDDGARRLRFARPLLRSRARWISWPRSAPRSPARRSPIRATTASSRSIARVVAVVDKAVAAFEEAGAHVEEVEIGIRRSQRELSDVWCRFIAPEAGRRARGFQARRHRPRARPPRRFSAGVLALGRDRAEA